VDARNIGEHMVGQCHRAVQVESLLRSDSVPYPRRCIALALSSGPGTSRTVIEYSIERYPSQRSAVS